MSSKIPITFALVAALGLSAASGWSMSTTPGKPVKKIQRASDIVNWQALDRRHLIVTLNSNRDYLLTLRNTCVNLHSAARLGVSSSNNTIYAGFDYITADGQRCSIQQINRLSQADKRSLVEA